MTCTECTYLVLHNLIPEELLGDICEVLKIPDERKVLKACCPLYICVTITKRKTRFCQMNSSEGTTIEDWIFGCV